MFGQLRLLALAATAALGLGMTQASAAVMLVGGNTYTGTLDPVQNLGNIDLDLGSFGFSGFTGAPSGGLTFNAFSSSLAPSAEGAMQILIQAQENASIVFTVLSFGGVPLTLNAATGGFAATIAGPLPSEFILKFENANVGDAVQITLAAVSAVPLPAGGLLLIGALGGLAALRRRKTV